jgi:hypothetical protein
LRKTLVGLHKNKKAKAEAWWQKMHG